MNLRRRHGDQFDNAMQSFAVRLDVPPLDWSCLARVINADIVQPRPAISAGLNSAGTMGAPTLLVQQTNRSVASCATVRSNRSCSSA